MYTWRDWIEFDIYEKSLELHIGKGKTINAIDLSIKLISYSYRFIYDICNKKHKSNRDIYKKIDWSCIEKDFDTSTKFTKISNKDSMNHNELKH